MKKTLRSVIAKKQSRDALGRFNCLKVSDDEQANGYKIHENAI